MPLPLGNYEPILVDLLNRNSSPVLQVVLLNDQIYSAPDLHLTDHDMRSLGGSKQNKSGKEGTPGMGHLDRTVYSLTQLDLAPPNALWPLPCL
ncbi:hypothetical protein ElyMa_003987700 [Elysia marginata]|uniref:Uncharacterized protein n=1 Tax=Elysia marginata TaxID=1093978 RepID=A0AAV4FZ28_9GAST|nr:hypothetical protein ElyMa_003987700 [Elysia marginata]